MRKFWRARENELGLRFYAILLMGGWTFVVLFSIIWRINQETDSVSHLAREIARSHLEKDLILRDWNIKHGFVYAPVTSEHQPNPHLNMEDREIVTPSGKTLTAINSSSIIRQIYELAEKKLSYRGHLTSLKPLRPENAPDPWEQQALRRLTEGEKEVSGVVNKDDGLYFRLMQPLTATENCLACHSPDDYTLNKVAGGISVILPMASVVGAWQRTKLAVFIAHGFLWLVGLLGLAFGARQLQRKIQAKNEIEMALRQSEGDYRLLVQTIPALVYRGYADGRVDFVDEKVEKLTGYSQEQFSSGRIKWPDIILPEDRMASKHIFIKALKTDLSYRREYRIRRKDGEIIWLAERSQIVCDPQGRIEFVSGVVLDISLQKEMEHSLKESERFWKTLLEAVGVGLMVIDKVNGRITEVNPQALAMLGYSREQIIGQSRERYFSCPLQQESPSSIPRGRKNRSEGRLVKADGALLPIWETAAPIKIGEMHYVLVSFVDLTDQQQAEMALTQANKNLQIAVAEAGQTNKEISLIGNMVELLQICQKPAEAYPIIGEYAKELFPEIAGALYVLNESNNLLTSVSYWGQNLTGEQFFSPTDCWALRQGRPYLCGLTSMAAINPRCLHVTASTKGSHFCMPLMTQGDILGLLYLEKMSTGEGRVNAGETEMQNGLTKSQQKLARTLAKHISLSLANLKLRESLRHQAIRDDLTGLFNRRYLQETLDRELHRALRRASTVGVVMLDVDHFKVFNDTHGHEAGDQVLAVLGRYLKDVVRAEDIACRYGGEEFTLVLPDISPENLLARAEHFREGVKKLEVLYQGKLLEGITASLGLSCFPMHGAESETLLQAADAALYQAKRNGRNRVVMSGVQPGGRSVKLEAAGNAL